MTFLRVLLVPLEAEWLCGCVDSSSLISGGGKENLSSPSNHTLYFLSLLPYPNPAHPPQPSWDEGPSVFIAEQLAVEHINNRTDILPGYTVELIQGVGGCDLSNSAVVSFVKYVMHSKLNVVGIIGPGCSSSARVIGSLTGPKRAALISFHLGGSRILHNQTLYPYSFDLREDTEVLEAFIALMKKANWIQVNTLYDESRLFTQTNLAQVEEALKNDPVHSIAFSSPIYDDYIPFDEIERSPVRVILLLAGPETVARTLCLAHYRGLVYPRYQWVAAYEQAFHRISFRFQRKRYECSEDEMWAVARGNIFFSLRITPENTSEATKSGFSYDQFATLYRNRVALYNSEENTTISPRFWAPAFYDAVWSLALALNNSNISLSAYDYKEQQNADIIKEQVECLEFNGVSGRVQFDNRTNFIHRAVVISAVMENRSFHRIGYYLGDSDLEITHPDIFIPALHIPDVDSDRYQLVDLPFTLVFMVLTILALQLLIATHVFSTVYRKFPSIKASSLQLTHLAFIGCYLLLLSVLSFIISRHIPKSSSICFLRQSVPVSTFVGSCLIESVVLARTWRLYRILVHFRNPGRFISNRYLFSFVLLITGIVVIINILLVLLDPPNVVDAPNGVKVCRREHFLLWILIFTGFNLLLVIPLMWYAMKCTFVPVPKKDFNTSRVLLLSFCVVATELIGIPSVLIFMLQETGTETAPFACYCVVHFMLVYAHVMILFVPPTWPLLRQKFLSKCYTCT